MPLGESEIRSAVESVSVSAIAYQARVLIGELENINPVEYPPEARQIRDVLICWPKYILEQLDSMQELNPLGVGGSDAVRLRTFGSVLHDIFSFIRYLTASLPRQAPPAVQAAVNSLIGRNFPAANGTPVCVIRPQWQYNLKYVPLTWHLRDLISPAALDPTGTLGIKTKADILPALWNWHLTSLAASEREELSKECPTQLAVVSFAGLDTRDSLLYPLLAHELGHFIDYSYSTPLNLDSSIQSSAQISHNEVEAILSTQAPVLLPSAGDILSALVQRVNVCLRELLADLLALRMAGFGFFAAQSEFLKSIAGWPESIITSSGYPGTRFRIWSILRHMLRADFPGNPRQFRLSNPDTSLSGIDHYLTAWEHRVAYGSTINDLPMPPTASKNVKQALEALAETAVRRSVDNIVTIAINAIPNDACATLTPDYYERVKRLKRDLPPVCSRESANSFAEILSAAWTYQLVYGEEREILAGDGVKRHAEYDKTCRLVHKAIELMAEPCEDLPQGTAQEVSAEATGVIGARHLLARITRDVNVSQLLAVVPVQKRSIGAASLDVRLGNWFAGARKSRLSSVKLDKPTDERLLATVGREETFVAHGKTFLIHPGDLVLGATLEFVALPSDLMAFVEGRSSLGRRGLIVATASQVAPGFHGVIVLELANAGTVPLELSPGMPIAQLVFIKMSEPLPAESQYRGRFYCQVKP